MSFTVADADRLREAFNYPPVYFDSCKRAFESLQVLDTRQGTNNVAKAIALLSKVTDWDEAIETQTIEKPFSERSVTVAGEGSVEYAIGTRSDVGLSAAGYVAVRQDAINKLAVMFRPYGLFPQQSIVIPG